MNISVFTILNVAVAALIVFLAARFAWNMWFATSYFPAEWSQAGREGRITPALRKLMRRYSDKTRFFGWWLQVERLRRDKIPGDFAEVGVYRGESAGILHRMDPDRKFHLFDTFEGFPHTDLAIEQGESAAYTTHHFADTHERSVLKKIGGNGNVIVHKGHFPETATKVADARFALVNLDADLYLPTKAALDFFYPRMVPGGVLFIHDHNHRWEGIKRAVKEFSDEQGLFPVFMPDPDSTAVLVKPKI